VGSRLEKKDVFLGKDSKVKTDETEKVKTGTVLTEPARIKVWRFDETMEKENKKGRPAFPQQRDKRENQGGEH